jgi:hypothetical protein
MPLSTIFLAIFLALFCVSVFVPERVLVVLSGIAAGVAAVALVLAR